MGIYYIVDGYVFCVPILDHYDLFELVDVSGVEMLKAGRLFVCRLKDHQFQLINNRQNLFLLFALTD